MITYQQLFSISCELIKPCQHHFPLLISLGQPDEDHEDFVDDDDEHVDDDGETFWPAPPFQPSSMSMLMMTMLVITMLTMTMLENMMMTINLLSISSSPAFIHDHDHVDDAGDDDSSLMSNNEC